MPQSATNPPRFEQRKAWSFAIEALTFFLGASSYLCELLLSKGRSGLDKAGEVVAIWDASIYCEAPLFSMEKPNLVKRLDPFLDRAGLNSDRLGDPFDRRMWNVVSCPPVI